MSGYCAASSYYIDCQENGIFYSGVFEDYIRHRSYRDLQPSVFGIIIFLAVL